jgi:tetratricopeptide (TPR) repeat protein
VRHTRHALKLSPLDPLKYYFDSLAATAALSAGNYERALQLADRSLRLNRTHASTLRVIVTALCRLGRVEDARGFAGQLMALEPGFTVTRYLERSPGAPYKLGRDVASALAEAGVPSGA